MKKYIYLSAALILLSCAAVEKSQTNSIQNTDLPNVIIVFADDQGYNDLGCFGSPNIKTPHIDALAEEGTIFTNFHAAQPVCTASRVSLLTGCYPNRLGMHGALMPEAQIGIHNEELTLAEMFKTKGYATAAFGKWHLGWQEPFNPLNHGFDEYYGIPYSNDMWPLHPAQGTHFNFPELPVYDGFERVDSLLEDQNDFTTRITEKAVSFIDKNADKPFFLYVPHPQPHVPLYVSDKFRGKSERGLYGDVIMEIDWSVGQIVKALEDNKIKDNTLIIYTSDNGPWLSYGSHSGSAYPLKEGKGTNWEGGTRVPCVMSLPNRMSQQRTTNESFMTIDILPSMARLIDADLPAHKIDGNDILSFILGESEENPHSNYAFYYKRNHLEAVTSDEWKLIFPHSYRSLQGSKGTNDGLPIPYKQSSLAKAELYNLAKDVEEKFDVYEHYPEVVSRLQALAETYRQDMGDALTEREGNNLREPGRVSDTK